MNSPHQAVEESLQRAGARWRGRRFARHSAVIVVLTCFALLLVGVAVLTGVVRTAGGFQSWMLFIAGTTLVAWSIVALNIVFGEIERGWLAGLLEKGSPHLQDRLNTLVHLEQAKSEPVAGAFYQRIGKQSDFMLQSKPAQAQFPSRGLVAYLGAAVLAFFLTVWFFVQFKPVARLAAAVPNAGASVELPAVPQEKDLPPPPNVAEAKEKWGEVRITEPARDLQVTKVDVVPLQIEAAANEAIREVRWLTAVNGAEEQPHELPLPAEPRYAAYQRTVYLEEFRLSDWDVLTYYAKARTESGNEIASQVYFLEVRPFREELLKTPGGEAGKCLALLNELTSMIQQQQQVIRETHRQLQQPTGSADAQKNERNKLAEAEADLSKASQHLAAQLSQEMAGKPVDPTLNQLARAEKSLAAAAEALREDQLQSAPPREREGLAGLLAARKAFQQKLSEDPDAFSEQKEQTPPVAERDRLKEIAEYRNEQKAAETFLQDAMKRQQSITRQAALPSRTNYPKLQADEKTLQQSLEDFQKDHPQAFNPLEKECNGAQESLRKAGQALANRNASASKATQEAAEMLDQLDRALRENSAQRQLTDAYQLKDMLDRQIRKLGQCQNASSGVSTSDLQSLAGQSRETLQKLKQGAGQGPGADHFGPELAESLNDKKLEAINRQLDDLAKAPSDDAKRKAAGDAKDSLSHISEAFDRSQPKSLQTARNSDALKGDETGAVERGLGQLGSLLQRLQERRPMNSDDRARQGRESLLNLQTGMKNRPGDKVLVQEILTALERELKQPEESVNPERLKQLLAQLQNFSLELGDRDKPSALSEVTNFDPAKGPPEYRGRIEKYFRKLSEK